ncbi:MAG: SCO2525 family SAM-dependent methyltransferase [Gammaproteobacteria bacterium]
MVSRRPYRKPSLVDGDGMQPAALASDPSPRVCTELNSDFPWGDFDSSWYYDHNYKVLRDDDRQIVEVVRDFFATLDLSSHGRYRNGIDVGSGANLYPTLTMLPLCDEITLYEYSASNVSWLQREIWSYSSSWDAFWEILVKEPLYKSIDSLQETLTARVRVKQGSIFDLPKALWDIGTMFFVAESISSTPSEFQTALRSFIRSLRPGAPFAAAFMEKSLGYTVGTHRFPAVAITVNDVENCLGGDTKDLETYRIGLTSNPLRAGYGGMILATGRLA